MNRRWNVRGKPGDCWSDADWKVFKAWRPIEGQQAVEGCGEVLTMYLD